MIREQGGERLLLFPNSRTVPSLALLLQFHQSLGHFRDRRKTGMRPPLPPVQSQTFSHSSLTAAKCRGALMPSSVAKYSHEGVDALTCHLRTHFKTSTCTKSAVTAARCRGAPAVSVCLVKVQERSCPYIPLTNEFRDVYLY
jgi:hypothetical protein